MLLKTLTFFSATFLTLFILWVIGLLWFAANISLSKPKSIEMTTDAIIVLTGATNRIDEGISLLRDKKADKLFISGVNKDIEDVSRITTDKDILPCCIELGYKAENTMGNAAETKEWILDKNIENIRLVTSNYHMMRSMLEFKKTLPDIEIIPHPVTPKNFAAWKKEFWPITFSEYNKTLLIALQFNQAK